jgi:hypothetical protein
MRKLLLVLVFASPLAAHANKAWGPFPATGSITISGPGVPTQTDAITQYYGDWYNVPNSAHASVTLMNSAPFPHALDMTLQLDGHETTQTITRATNSPSVGPGKKAFIYTPPGGKLSLTLGTNDSITVTIARFDDLNIEATFTGTTSVINTNGTQSTIGPVQISGSLSLHRLKHVELHSGAWIDCDPVIHDAYALVIPRSASECEVKYDLHARQALNEALQPVITSMQAEQWIAQTQPNLKPVDSEMRGSETSPYEAGASVSFYLDKSSPVYQHNQQVLDDAGAKMKSQMSGGGAANPQFMQQMAAQIAANTLPTTFYLKTLMNLPKMEVVNFSRKHTVTQLPGVGTEIEFDDAQPPTGGSEGAPVTWVLVGSWLPPVFEPLGDGGEKAVFRGGLNPNKPLMSAQNYYLVIYSTHQQAAKVIENIDWAPIRALLAER